MRRGQPRWPACVRRIGALRAPRHNDDGVELDAVAHGNHLDAFDVVGGIAREREVASMSGVSGGVCANAGDVVTSRNSAPWRNRVGEIDRIPHPNAVSM